MKRRIFFWAILLAAMARVPSVFGVPKQAKYWIFFQPAKTDETGIMEKDRIRSLQSIGIKPGVVSRWLDAISAVVPDGRLDQVRMLPNVLKMQPVASFPSKCRFGTCWKNQRERGNGSAARID